MKQWKRFFPRAGCAKNGRSAPISQRWAPRMSRRGRPAVVVIVVVSIAPMRGAASPAVKNAHSAISVRDGVPAPANMRDFARALR